MTEQNNPGYSAMMWTPPDAADPQVMLALKMAELGQVDLALSKLDAGESTSALFAKAYVLQSVGRSEEAVKGYLAFLKLSPETTEAHFNIGLSLVSHLVSQPDGAPKNHALAEDAEDHLRTALRHRPDLTLCNFLIGRLMLFRGEAKAAVKVLSDHAHAQITDVEAWRALGEAHASAGQTEESLTAYFKCVELDPEGSATRTILDAVRREQNERKISQVCDDLLKGAAPVMVRAEALALQGKTVESVAAAAGQQPTPEYLSALAQSFAADGKNTEAVEALLTALSMEFVGPRRVDFSRLGVPVQLADLCLKDGRTEALICALKVNPVLEEAYDLLETALADWQASKAPYGTASGQRTTNRIIFNTIVWGQSFVDRFLNYALPSFLTRNNLPALCDGLEVEYIIMTTPEDQAVLEANPVIADLRNYVTVRYQEIEPQTGAMSVYGVIGDSWRAFIRYGAERDAGLLFVSPDTIIADGGLRTVREAMEAGHRAVLTLTLTALDSPFLENIDKAENTLSSQDLADLAYSHLHPLIGWLSSDSPEFTNWPYVTYWQGGGQSSARGFMLHPVYIHPADWSADFRATVDWDYAAKAVPNPAEIKVIGDSDALMIVEFSDAGKREPGPGQSYANPFDQARWARNNMIPATWPLFQEKMWLHGHANRSDLARLEQKSETFAKAVDFLLNRGL